MISPIDPGSQYSDTICEQKKHSKVHCKATNPEGALGLVNSKQTENILALAFLESMKSRQQLTHDGPALIGNKLQGSV